MKFLELNEITKITVQFNVRKNLILLILKHAIWSKEKLCYGKHILLINVKNILLNFLAQLLVIVSFVRLLVII